MTQAIRRLLAILLLSLSVYTARSQANAADPFKAEPKPYSIQTSGKQITVKSSQRIKHIMVWTPGGDRVVEQKDIDQNTFSFTVPVNASFFFLMVGLSNGKIYTEKIGVR